MGVIYCIENLINGKKYIGQTKRNVKTRWTEHINKKSRCWWYLGRAIQKHGVKNFKFSILVYCLNIDMNYYEHKYIEEYKSFGEGGYNLTSGGDFDCIQSEESRKKNSDSKLGEKNPMFGKTHDENARNRIGAAQLGINNSHARKVIQMDLKGVFIKQFDSIADAKRMLNIPSAKIFSCCQNPKTPTGRLKTSCGFTWKYVDIIERNNQKYKNKSTVKFIKRKVIQMDLNGTFIQQFDSIADARRSINKLDADISRCCVGQRNTSAGFKWRYADQICT